MKYIFIINPISGKKQGYKIGYLVEDYCKTSNLDYIIHYTHAPHDATKYAKLYKRGQHVIYAIGGDGTVNEVVNGIVGTKNKLSIIPIGSGNDFFHYLENEPLNEFKCDVGKINNYYFINVANIGIDSEIGHNANIILRNKKIPPTQIYNASIFYTLFKYKYKYLELEFNNIKKNGIYTTIAICNGKYYGGGYHINPPGSINDGLLDVYLLSFIPKFKLPSLILKLKKGKHLNSRYIYQDQVNNIKIKSHQSLICSIDGETIIDTKFNIKIIQNALTLYYDQTLIKVLKKELK